MDFERFYNLYPSRAGAQNKYKAMQILQQTICNQNDYEGMEKAILNYRSYCDSSRQTGTDWVKMFSNFVTSDWLEWRDKSLQPKDFLSQAQKIERGFCLPYNPNDSSAFTLVMLGHA